MNEWQPIETAPKDGTTILAYCQPRYTGTDEPMEFSYVSVIRWMDKYKNSKCPWRHALNNSAAEPIHWMPIPPAPSAGEEK